MNAKRIAATKATAYGGMLINWAADAVYPRPTMMDGTKKASPKSTIPTKKKMIATMITCGATSARPTSCQLNNSSSATVSP